MRPFPLALALALGACAQGGAGGGDPARGRIVIVRMACGSCHVIPGIEGADGRVGPSLAGFRARRMIAGALPNDGRNLRRYLMSPRTIVPGNAMPDQRLSDAEAGDVAAYLATLG